MKQNSFNQKIRNFIFEKEKNRKNFNILEFGVREGRSTKMFLEMLSNKNDKLVSIDVDDYSNLFNHEKWTFIKTRDDNLNEISKHIDKGINIILIDSLHEPNHVIKLVNMYWKFLEVDGNMYIDDISWLPYSKGNWRDHKYTENINFDTFNLILNLLNTNSENFNLEFNFQDSGMARLTKLKDVELNKSNKIIRRNNFIKKFFK